MGVVCVGAWVRRREEEKKAKEKADKEKRLLAEKAKKEKEIAADKVGEGRAGHTDMHGIRFRCSWWGAGW